VVRRCVLENWLPGFPGGWQWEALAEEPDECELLTDAQVDALWVGHLDEGLLMLQKYGHLAPGHGQEAAKKLNGAWH